MQVEGQPVGDVHPGVRRAREGRARRKPRRRVQLPGHQRLFFRSERGRLPFPPPQQGQAECGPAQVSGHEEAVPRLRSAPPEQRGARSRGAGDRDVEPDALTGGDVAAHQRRSQFRGPPRCGFGDPGRGRLLGRRSDERDERAGRTAPHRRNVAHRGGNGPAPDGARGMETAVEVDTFFGRIRRQQERAATRQQERRRVISRPQSQARDLVSPFRRKRREAIQNAPEQPLLSGCGGASCLVHGPRAGSRQRTASVR